MRRIALLLIMLILVLTIAIPVELSASSIRWGEGRIIGYVYDAETSEPIAGAIVGIVQTGDVTYTDENGYYEFDDVEPGVYIVGAVADGYKPSVATVTVPPGQTVQQDFYLEPIEVPQPSAIEGYVYDALTEEPIAGASITVVELNETTYTDEKGYYRVEVPPGNYTVEACARGYLSQQQNVIVPPFETVELDFYLVPIPSDTAIIYGYVRSVFMNQPINGAYVIVLDELKLVRSRENGFYIVEVDGGIHIVIVFAQGYLPSIKIVEVEIGEAKQVDFQLIPLNIPPYPYRYHQEPIPK